MELKLGHSGIKWPDGKQFAFTIIDDTDGSTVENARPIYDFLAEHGFRTTKTVWPLAEDQNPITGGDSLQNAEYRKWVLELKRAGFEIALHGVADGSSRRDRIIAGLNYFGQVIGEAPTLHTNHKGQREAIYWGAARFDYPVRWLYECARQRHKEYFGIDPRSPHFWGDLCLQGPKYVRNLVFTDINTLKMDQLMPYYDPYRPYVQNWFSGSYGSRMDVFCRLLSEANQDRLIAEGGACILHTHFGTFGRLSSDFKYLIRRLSELPGWFVPATSLLDFLGSKRGWLNVAEHRVAFQRMQIKWFRQRSCQQITSSAASIFRSGTNRQVRSGVMAKAG